MHFSKATSTNDHHWVRLCLGAGLAGYAATWGSRVVLGAVAAGSRR